MKVSISPKVRYPLVLALGIALGCYLWETRSPWMGAEKFYRNTKVVATYPVELGFPQTVIRADLSGQSALSLHCVGDVCRVHLVIFEREFDPVDKAILPNGYIPFLREGIVLSDFRIRAYVGSISRDEFKKVLAEIKLKNPRRLRIGRSVRNKLVAKVLEMHFLGAPLRLELRPEASIARIQKSRLRVMILASITKLEGAK